MHCVSDSFLCWRRRGSFVKDRAFPPNSVNGRERRCPIGRLPSRRRLVRGTLCAARLGQQTGGAGAPPPLCRRRRRARFCVILCVQCVPALPCALSSRAPARFLRFPPRIVGSFRGFFAPLAGLRQSCVCTLGPAQAGGGGGSFVRQLRSPVQSSFVRSLVRLADPLTLPVCCHFPIKIYLPNFSVVCSLALSSRSRRASNAAAAAAATTSKRTKTSIVGSKSSSSSSEQH